MIFISFVNSLYTSFDSPFSDDSSTDNFPLIKIPSAGIFSPLDKIITSFFTMSSIDIYIIFLFLLTRTFIFDDSSCILSNALLDPYSLIADISDATKMAITIPIVSK